MADIVVFSTSDIQTLTQSSSGYEVKSTGLLEQALVLDFSIFVISTRHKLSETDRWWLSKVASKCIYLASGPMDSMCACSPALIAPWLKLFQDLGIPLPPKARPEDDTEWLQDELEGPLPQLYGFHSWLEARDHLENLNGRIMTGQAFKKQGY